MKKSTTLFFFLVISINGLATVFHVPADYSTIQSALNACQDGDTVFVEPGTYVENINWPGTGGIKLISTGDSSNTIIDGNAASNVIMMSGYFNPDTTTLIRGFTIRNGKATGEWADGAGVYIDSWGAVFENDLITANHCEPDYYYSGSGSGAGVFCNSGIVVVRNTAINGNVIDPGGDWADGAGIFSMYSDVRLDHSSVTGNSSHANT